MYCYVCIVLTGSCAAHFHKVETCGNDGNVDEAQELMQKVDQLKTEKDRLLQKQVPYLPPLDPRLVLYVTVCMLLSTVCMHTDIRTYTTHTHTHTRARAHGHIILTGCTFSFSRQ